MFIINPDPYSLPSYRIGPFQTIDLSLNHNLPDNNHIDSYFKKRFQGKDYVYTENGRKAMHLAFKSFKLQKDDVVTILTTTENFYISGCVTAEIEKFCKWSRKMEKNTKLIFVNHEFGYPYPDIAKLLEYNIPIIEDCAGSFFSEDSDHSIGNIGDYVIYSFPKMFKLQVGGLLVSNRKERPIPQYQLDQNLLKHIKNVLSFYINDKEKIIHQRISNYKFLREKFESMGFSERFALSKGAVPGVFMFKMNDHRLNLPELKKYFWDHGVQCSVFYGEEAFFIPVHQSLSEEDMMYFYEIMKSYLDNNLN